MFCRDGSWEPLNCKDISLYMSLTLVTSLSPGLNYESFPARQWPCPLSTNLCSILMILTHVKPSSAQSIASSHSHTLISTHGLSFFFSLPSPGSFSTLLKQFSIGPYGSSERWLLKQLGVIFLSTFLFPSCIDSQYGPLLCDNFLRIETYLLSGRLFGIPDINLSHVSGNSWILQDSKASTQGSA